MNSQAPITNSQATPGPTNGGAAAPPYQAGTEFIVTLRGYGVRFHKNHCGNMYEMVKREDATRFGSQDQAWEACVRVNMPAGTTIEPAECVIEIDGHTVVVPKTGVRK